MVSYLILLFVSGFFAFIFGLKKNSNDMSISVDLKFDVNKVKILVVDNNELNENFIFFIPIVLMSANNTMDSKDSFISQGFTDCLSKLLNKDELVNLLNRLLMYINY